MPEPFQVERATFDAFIAPEAGPALVEFCAPWCPPCLALAPAIRMLTRRLSGMVRVGQVDVDESPDIAGRFQVQSIPTLVLFDRGVPILRLVGFQSLSALIASIEGALRPT